jgi:hypothetical protein
MNHAYIKCLKLVSDHRNRDEVSGFFSLEAEDELPDTARKKDLSLLSLNLLSNQTDFPTRPDQGLERTPA